MFLNIIFSVEPVPERMMGPTGFACGWGIWAGAWLFVGWFCAWVFRAGQDQTTASAVLTD